MIENIGESGAACPIVMVLALITAVVDYLVHPGQLGPGATEAVSS